MSDAAIHPQAPHFLPSYLPAADGSDWLFNFTAVVVIAIILVVGNLYLRLHSVPERMAHRSNSVQLQAVAVLCLLALFTHNHLLWILALLLAIIRFPDLATPLNTIAAAVERRELLAENAGPAAPTQDKPASSPKSSQATEG
ncbi:MAG: hypothetical protein AAGB11_19660 [Pseudomonadota bacterium]